MQEVLRCCPLSRKQLVLQWAFHESEAPNFFGAFFKLYLIPSLYGFNLHLLLWHDEKQKNHTNHSYRGIFRGRRVCSIITFF